MCETCKDTKTVEVLVSPANNDGGYINDEVWQNVECPACHGSSKYAEDCHVPDTICEYKNCKHEAFYHYGTEDEHDNATSKHYCKEHCPADQVQVAHNQPVSSLQ